MLINLKAIIHYCHTLTFALTHYYSHAFTGFESLFVESVPFLAKYDCTFSVTLPSSIGKRYPTRILDRGGDWVAFANSLVAKLIRKGVCVCVFMSI